MQPLTRVAADSTRAKQPILPKQALCYTPGRGWCVADGRSTVGSQSWQTHWALGNALAGRIHTANWRRDCHGRLILDAMLSKVVSHQ